MPFYYDTLYTLLQWHTICPFTMIHYMSFYYDTLCPFTMTHYMPFYYDTLYALLQWHTICPFTMTHYVLLLWHIICPFTMTHYMSLYYDTLYVLLLWHTICLFYYDILYSPLPWSSICPFSYDTICPFYYDTLYVSFIITKVFSRVRRYLNIYTKSEYQFPSSRVLQAGYIPSGKQHKGAIAFIADTSDYHIWPLFVVHEVVSQHRFYCTVKPILRDHCNETNLWWKTTVALTWPYIPIHLYL